MSVDIKVRGVEQLRLMAKQLREADRVDLLRGMQRGIRKAAKPTLTATKQAARDIHTAGVRKPGSTRPFLATFGAKGTREKIAGAVTADIKLGEEPLVRFRVAASKLPPELKNMPVKFDEGKWRHPVMGNRDVWVSQTSDPWFWPPIRDHIRDFRQAIDDEIGKVRDKLEAG